MVWCNFWYLLLNYKVTVTTYVISAYYHYRCEFEPLSGMMYSIQYYVVKLVSVLRQVGGILPVLRFPPPIRRGFAPGFVNYKKGALDSQSHVIKFVRCFPMVGGSLWFPVSSTTRTCRHDIAEILLQVALNNQSNQILKWLVVRISHKPYFWSICGYGNIFLTLFAEFNHHWRWDIRFWDTDHQKHTRGAVVGVIVW